MTEQKWNLETLKEELNWIVLYAEQGRGIEDIMGSFLDCFYAEGESFASEQRDDLMLAVEAYYLRAEQGRQSELHSKILSGEAKADAETTLTAFLMENHVDLVYPNGDSFVKEMRQLPYKQFLLTQYWKLVRAVVLKKCGGRCQVCNRPGSIHVHHRTYQHHGEEHKYLGDLVALCSGCHKTFHEAGKLYRG